MMVTMSDDVMPGGFGRRTVLCGAGVVGAAALAGCAGGDDKPAGLASSMKGKEIAKATDATIVGPAAPRKSPFDTRVYQSTHVTGSQNVQIGSGNTQTVTFVDKLNAANVAIDHSTATMEEKRETKSLLKRLSENKFLASVLALVFSHHSAS